ncbi:MAG: myo-inositol-1-phosphate synthase, partial [Candidatus Aenigmarchaeota archaeon]|nr:myo-inositol-1-phosphate synthase [Candidatus Aenigmarchaeota archaeon]
SKVANSPVFVELAEASSSVLIGDDISSGQSRMLSDLMEHYKEINRKILSAVGANWGGNMDFYRLKDKKRNESKRATKTGCAQDILGYDLPSDIKPHGYLAPLGDKKTVFMHFPMKLFNEAEDEIFICGRINDSPAAAGMLLDMVRLGAVAVSRGEKGVISPINSFYCKWFGKQHSKILAYQKLMGWLENK